jgi:NADH-quinone oxidoreductase subunit N
MPAGPITLQFTSLDAWALLPVWILSAAGCLAIAVDLLSRRRGATLAGWTALIGFAGAGVATWAVRDVSRVVFSGLIAVDPFAHYFTLLFCGIGVLSVLLSWDYVRRLDLHHGEYYALMIFSVLGMVWMAQANDWIMIFIGLELMSLALYVMAGMRRSRFESTEAAMKYFLLGAFASGFLLYGIALLYGATGTTNLARQSGLLIESPLAGNVLLLAGAALVLVGFAFKISAVPFHMWTPDAYEGAPTSVTAFMSAGAKAAGFAALVRVAAQVLPQIDLDLTRMLEGVTILTLVVGNVVAVMQNNLKRMLAYSSIAHAGYALVGIVAGGTAGHSAVLFYLAAYAAMTVGAFGVLTLLGRGLDERLDVREIGGVGRRHPLLAGLFTLFLLGLAGIPPTAGFIGKFFLFQAAVEAGHVPLVIVALLASVVSVYYYLRPVVVMYMQEPAGSPVEVTRSAAAGIALALAAAATLVLGVVPGGLAEAAVRCVLDLLP